MCDFQSTVRCKTNFVEENEPGKDREQRVNSSCEMSARFCLYLQEPQRRNFSIWLSNEGRHSCGSGNLKSHPLAQTIQKAFSRVTFLALCFLADHSTKVSPKADTIQKVIILCRRQLKIVLIAIWQTFSPGVIQFATRQIPVEAL